MTLQPTPAHATNNDKQGAEPSSVLQLQEPQPLQAIFISEIHDISKLDILHETLDVKQDHTPAGSTDGLKYLVETYISSTLDSPANTPSVAVEETAPIEMASLKGDLSHAVYPTCLQSTPRISVM